jgi:hypothetical protein
VSVSSVPCTARKGWRTQQSLLFFVSDHIVFDPVIDLARHHAFFEKVLFRPVRSEADDAPGPALRHPRHLQEFIQRSVIDVDARLRRWRLRPLRSALTQSAQHDAHNQSRQHESRSHSHCTIHIHGPRFSCNNKLLRWLPPLPAPLTYPLRLVAPFLRKRGS